MPSYEPRHSNAANPRFENAGLVPAESRLSVRTEDIVELNPYAVDVRYADDWREPQLSDAKIALLLAYEVRDEIRRRMPPATLG